MNEVIAAVIFVLIMMFIQLNDIKKIQIKARTNYVRMIMSITISIASVIIFWPDNLPRQIELVAISGLILFFGFIPEGLGRKQLIKVGTLDGSYEKYQKIEIESDDKKGKFSRITFFVRKNNSIFLVVKGNKNKIFKYMEEMLPDTNKIELK